MPRQLADVPFHTSASSGASANSVAAPSIVSSANCRSVAGSAATRVTETRPK
jgi:hypothetical protein